MTPEFWRGRRVLITGHTGFKGAWLAFWLARLGAHVSGLSLKAETKPSLWQLLSIDDRVVSRIGNICDERSVRSAMKERPEVVFHLAAQSLVRRSYRDPVETFATNVTGTVQVLHQAAQTGSVKAVVVVTSDKAYENPEHGRAFVESDPFGGSDPYSASKGATEIATTAMRRSYFSEAAGSGIGVASARAGNVIGGGDWSEDRLVPDIVRGCLSPARSVTLRSPGSVRPWQHVLDPLHGYIVLAERLYCEPAFASQGWNFGPARSDERDVKSVAEAIIEALGQGRIVYCDDSNAPKESKILRLDASHAREALGWQPVLDFDSSIAMTARWYAEWHNGASARDITAQQIDAFMARIDAKEMT